MSYEGDGMKFRDLSRSSGNPTSPMSAFHIFRSRFGNRGTARQSRKTYEFVPDCLPLCAFSHRYSKRPWSLFLGFFVILAILAPLSPFLFGRIMVIETFIRVCTTELLPCIS